MCIDNKVQRCRAWEQDSMSSKIMLYPLLSDTIGREYILWVNVSLSNLHCMTTWHPVENVLKDTFIHCWNYAKRMHTHTPTHTDTHNALLETGRGRITWLPCLTKTIESSIKNILEGNKFSCVSGSISRLPENWPSVYLFPEHGKISLNCNDIATLLKIKIVKQL